MALRDSVTPSAPWGVGITRAIAAAAVALQAQQVQDRRVVLRPILIVLLIVALVLVVLKIEQEDEAFVMDDLMTEATRLYLEGRYAEALPLYRKAADLGEVHAMRDLGHAYLHGNGVELDYAEGMRWYRMAADKGFAGAMTNIGGCYKEGMGVKQDYAEAMRWYRKAADKGDAGGMEWIGVLYQLGQGVAQDHAEAFRWFSKAADAGEMSSTWQLALYYYDGLDVRRDLRAALREHRMVHGQHRTCEAALRVWLCLKALGRMDKAREYLAEDPHRYLIRGFSCTVWEFLARRITEAELLESLLRTPEEGRVERTRLAHLYLGYVKLYAGLEDEAVRHLRACVRTIDWYDPSYRTATAELSRLQAR